jgi:phenylacetic acid degradation operon negative regulatory protein
MEAEDGALRPRRGDSAKSVLLTVLGEFVLPSGGSAWTGTLVDALATLDYRDRNARQVLTRLRDDGHIEAERRGRRTRWHLTDPGRRLLEGGTERIYRFGRRAARWDGRWLLVHCPVPETMRRERRLLQTRLSFEGFGFLSPAVAVSPHGELEATANSVLTELGLADLAVVMAGTTGSLSPDDVILDRAWDLAGLRAAYRSFIERFESVDPDGDEACFAEVVGLVHAWRRFPFRDPGIPLELLPDDWVGVRARELFDDRRTRWSPGATAFYKEREAWHDG